MTAAARLLTALGATDTTWETNGALSAWLAGPGSILDVLDNLCRDTATDPGWSLLLDVTRCPTYALGWLGQFVGVRVDPHASDTAQRAAITAEAGFKRGTVAAIRAAATPFLKGTQTVRIDERDTGAYHLTVTVWSGELIGASYADLSTSYATYTLLDAAFATYDAYSASSAALLAALAAAKPAGLQMTVTIASGTPPP